MSEGQDDLAIIAELEKVREPTQRWLAHHNMQEQSGVFRTTLSPDISTFSKPVITALEAHPRFKAVPNRFFGGKQIMLCPYHQATNLLRVAAETDSYAAVEWLKKVYATEVTGIRFVAEVYGLTTSERVTLNNGVTLVPLKDLPPSRNARDLVAQFQTFHFISTRPMQQPIGAVLDLSQVKRSTESTEFRSDELERSIRAFTLADNAAPAIGVSWIDFVDPDLAKAEAFQMAIAPGSEGAFAAVAKNIDADAIAWVDRYLQLDSGVKRVCDIALERLNLARRRISPGNKAIEGAICLEALLGDDTPHELVYKLKLRAALLLETELEKRRAIQKSVGEFYSLRSHTVHGRVNKTGDAQLQACADRGLEICARALRIIVQRNEKPVPSDWELIGGVAPLN
jgi:hypothetical protein